MKAMRHTSAAPLGNMSWLVITIFRLHPWVEMAVWCVLNLIMFCCLEPAKYHHWAFAISWVIRFWLRRVESCLNDVDPAIARRSAPCAPFRFLDLPRELRDEILELAVTDDGSKLCLDTKSNGWHHCHDCSNHDEVFCPVPMQYRIFWWDVPIRDKCVCVAETYSSLLLVNKQIGRDVRPLFFKHNDVSYEAVKSVASTGKEVMTARGVVVLSFGTRFRVNIWILRKEFWVSFERGSTVQSEEQRRNDNGEVLARCLRESRMHDAEAQAAMREALKQISKALTLHLSNRKSDDGDTSIGALAIAVSEAVGTTVGTITLHVNMRLRNGHEPDWQKRSRMRAIKITIDNLD